MIGLSLSQCIRELIEGKIGYDAIEKIVAGTKIETTQHLADVLLGYSRTAWSQAPDMGRSFALRLFAEGKVDQPRVRGEAPYFCGQTIWVENEEALAAIERSW